MTTLIKNGLVYDGISREPRRADVFFENKRIRAVRPFLRMRANRVIEAQGRVCIPGLIDTNSDIDQYGGLFSRDIQREFLRRGITTAIGGGAGISLAEIHAYPLNSFQGNVDWDTFRQFLKVLRNERLSLHVGMMAGYRNFFSPFLSKEEIQKRVSQALQEGALGISFNWDDPMSYPVSSPRLLQDLAAILSASKKVCSFSFDFSRACSGKLGMILRLFSRFRGKLHISRFRPHASAFFEWESLCGGAGYLKSYADISLASHLPYPVYGFLPPSFRSLELSEMAERVLCPEYQEEILSYLKRIPLLEEAYVGRLPHHLAWLRGRRLRSLVFRFQMELPRALLHLMRLSRLHAALFIRNAHPRHILPFLRHPSSLCSSGGALPLSSFLPHVQTFSISSLSALADHTGLLFGELLSKMTSAPARLYGISRRGSIAEGAYADLVLLNNWDVSQVFVDGELVFDRGVFYDRYPGKVIS